ncbi:MAG: hypothetical protein L0Z62_45715 [Gemmataceae bacterium]|nr:hypothetical protein [Gemmataceae bacterium]
MTGQEKIARGYKTNIRQPADAADGYHVFYAPRALQYARGNGGAPAPIPPSFEAIAQFQGDDLTVRWVNAPTDPEATREDFEQDARGRVRTLHDWLGRLSCLIHSVEEWARELGWATRWIDKPMEDAQIGEYRAPGLLLQEGPDRLYLEPIGRSAPGADGVVDLYLMPAYDDIASLHHYDGRWNLHYLFPGTAAVADIRKAPAKPLSRESLQEVLAEMRQHAASR